MAGVTEGGRGLSEAQGRLMHAERRVRKSSGPAARGQLEVRAGAAQRARGQEQSAKIQELKQNLPLPLRQKCCKNKQDKNRCSLGKLNPACRQAGVSALCSPDGLTPPCWGLGGLEAQLWGSFTWLGLTEVTIRALVGTAQSQFHFPDPSAFCFPI